MNESLLNRRRFLRLGAAGLGLFAAGGLPSVRSAPAADAAFFALRELGPLQPADAHGMMLPAGFQYRIVARTGEAPAGLPGYTWHPAPDGGACFATEDGGWVYVSNSEVRSNEGGVGALRFDGNGQVIDAYSILRNTSVNCAGGATPWGTWLSCEEFPHGQVYECDPMGRTEARVRPALGTFAHEAVAVDTVNEVLYLTEDMRDGGFYRFVPARGLPNLEHGRLEIARVVNRQGTDYVEWFEVPDPLAKTEATRYQAAHTPFAGGEGIAFHEGLIYFVTKHDNRVWAYDTASQRLEVIYDVETSDNPILSGVDNVLITPGGDVLVAEDGGDMQIVAITPDQELAPLVQIRGQDRSEICGPALDPACRRLYFSSQRGITGDNQGGITYEVSRVGTS